MRELSNRALNGQRLLRWVGLVLLAALPVALFVRTRQAVLMRPRVLQIGGGFSGVRTIVFSTDGEMVAAANGGNDVRVWETATGRELLALGGPRGYQMQGGVQAPFGLSLTRALSFASDGASLLTLHAEAEVKVWDIATGKLRRTFSVSDGINHFQGGSFSRDGRSLEVISATAASAMAHRAWLRSYSPAGAARRRPEPVLVAAPLKTYDVNTGRLRSTVAARSDHPKGMMILGLALSPDGATRAYSGITPAGKWRSWTVRDGVSKTPPDGRSFGSPLAFSPDGKVIAGAGFSRRRVSASQVETGDFVVLRDARSLRKLNVFKDSVHFARALSYSPDGRTLAAGGFGFRPGGGFFDKESVVQMWNAKTGQVTRTITTGQGSVDRLAFSPDGATLATGGLTGTVKLWRIQ